MQTEIRTLSTAKVEPKTYIEWDAAFAVLTITKDGASETYAVTEFPTTWDGRAVKLAKANGDWYDVFVCRRGQKNTCDCAGFTYSGRCKHQDAVRHLIHTGTLGAAPAKPEPEAVDDAEPETPF